MYFIAQHRLQQTAAKYIQREDVYQSSYWAQVPP